jgi:hypothetical protein
MDLAPFLFTTLWMIKRARLKEGCQGFSGPFPSAFLDKFIPGKPGIFRLFGIFERTEAKISLKNLSYKLCV